MHYLSTLNVKCYQTIFFVYIHYEPLNSSNDSGCVSLKPLK